MTVGSATPRGLGVYTSRLVREWDARRAAKEIAEYREMGAAYVLLCAEAADGWQAPHGVLVNVADHLKAAGCAVGVYALPSRAAWMEPEALADRLFAAAIACGATILVPDIEEQAIGLGPQVAIFRARLTNRITERHAVMVTLYGKIPRKPRRARAGFPWAEIVGWGSLGYQLYRTAENDAAVDERMADAAWHWGPDVVPHLATYLGGADRLRDDIERTCVAGGRVIVPGLAIWQDSTCDRAERLVLAAFAKRAGWIA